MVLAPACDVLPCLPRTAPPCRFHVDDMSSAHVYLRLPEGTTMDDIPEETLEDCAQLVKQNSIQGACVHAKPGMRPHACMQPCVRACGPWRRAAEDSCWLAHVAAMTWMFPPDLASGQGCGPMGASAGAATAERAIVPCPDAQCLLGHAGCKTNNVSIVYTPWANLKKTASMEVGQVRHSMLVKKCSCRCKQTDLCFARPPASLSLYMVTAGVRVALNVARACTHAGGLP